MPPQYIYLLWQRGLPFFWIRNQLFSPCHLRLPAGLTVSAGVLNGAPYAECSNSRSVTSASRSCTSKKRYIRDSSHQHPTLRMLKIDFSIISCLVKRLSRKFWENSPASPVLLIFYGTGKYKHFPIPLKLRKEKSLSPAKGGTKFLAINYWHSNLRSANTKIKKIILLFLKLSLCREY